MPWAALGRLPVPKLLRYSVTRAFANSGATVTLDTAGVGRVMTRTGAGTLILADQVVAVVISPARTTGDVASMATSWRSVEHQCRWDANATHDGQDSAPFYARTRSEVPAAPGGEFDDVVIWIPQTLLASRLIAAGRLP